LLIADSNLNLITHPLVLVQMIGKSGGSSLDLLCFTSRQNEEEIE